MDYDNIAKLIYTQLHNNNHVDVKLDDITQIIQKANLNHIAMALTANDKYLLNFNDIVHVAVRFVD